MNEIIEVVTKTGVHVLIDYLTITFPFICYEDDFELKIVEEVVTMVSQFLGFIKDQVIKDEYARNRYQYQYTIGDNITLRLIGPELKSGYHSCVLEMKGQGCREYELASENNSWIKLLEFFLIRLNAQVTRLDIAIDDYEGKDVDMPYIKEKLERKFYNSSFRKKYHKIMGCEEEGWTLQLGGHHSSQTFQIYDKLKEQQYRQNPCNQKYWVRYEMRFYLDKAYNIAMSLFDAGEANFRQFVFRLLYTTLDLKENNNLDSENQHKIKTDLRWQGFLESVEKAKIEKYKIRSTTFQDYKAWASPHAAFFFLVTLLECSGNDEQTITYLYQNALTAFEGIDSTKLKKINRFRKELGQSKIDERYLNELKKKLEKVIEERSLPF